MLPILCKVILITRIRLPLLIIERIAGSETTATTLATVTWYLAHSPEILSRLQHEVRTTFQSYEAINARTTSKLYYMHTVCLEALRMYPPLPLGLPRVVPDAGAILDGHFVQGGVRIDALAFQDRQLRAP